MQQIKGLNLELLVYVQIDIMMIVETSCVRVACIFVLLVRAQQHAKPVIQPPEV